MRSVEIKKGSLESKVETLATFTISTVFAPAYQDDTVFIRGGHDSDNLGLVYKEGAPLCLKLSKDYAAHVFDADDFDGIMFFQFVLSKPATKDLIFPIYFKDS